jgi:hypothetical protein
MHLGGELSSAETGTAVMRIAECNNVQPEAGSRPRSPPTRSLPSYTGCSPWTTS